MRDSEYYRDWVAFVNEKYPDQLLFKCSEIARMMGVGRRTVEKLFKFENGYISKVNLCRALAKIGGAR